MSRRGVGGYTGIAAADCCILLGARFTALPARHHEAEGLTVNPQPQLAIVLMLKNAAKITAAEQGEVRREGEQGKVVS